MEGRILIAERPKDKISPGLWEFPGGKIEPNESCFDALKREFREEIGIEILIAEPWFSIQHTYPDRTVVLNNWIVKKFSGIPRGAEGQMIQWVFPQALSLFQFPEGNKIILEKIQQVKL